MTRHNPNIAPHAEWGELPNYIPLAEAGRVWLVDRSTLVYHMDRGHIAYYRSGGIVLLSLRSLYRLYGPPRGVAKSHP